MFNIKQGDTSPSIKTRLLDGVNPVDLTNVDDVNFYMEDEYDRVIVSDNLAGRVNILDKSSGDVEYVFKKSDTSDVGKYRVEWEVVFDSAANRRETFPSEGTQFVKVTEAIK